MKAYLKVFDKYATELTKGKTQADAPKIAEELQKQLPSQGRNELARMVEYNLRLKYLPK
jgi:hypothetical protein